MSAFTNHPRQGPPEKKTNSVWPPTAWLEVATKSCSFGPPLPPEFRARGGCRGGSDQFGESPAEGPLAREFMEETGLVARVGNVLDVVSDVAVWDREAVRLHSVRLIYRGCR